MTPEQDIAQKIRNHCSPNFLPYSLVYMNILPRHAAYQSTYKGKNLPFSWIGEKKLYDREQLAVFFDSFEEQETAPVLEISDMKSVVTAFLRICASHPCMTDADIGKSLGINDQSANILRQNALYLLTAHHSEEKDEEYFEHEMG